MKAFTMENPTKVFFGEGVVKHLGIEIKAFGNKVLLVYGLGSIKRNGIYEDVMAQFELMDIEFVELGGVGANPRLSTVVEGAKMCREHKVAMVLAVGGGSVIDCAKSIAAAACYDYDPWRLISFQDKPIKALPIGTVLTISATGSEMNDGSVITNEVTAEKFGWGSECLYPKFSILDPTYTFTVNKHQTACGIVDMLSHLFEFYFSLEEEGYISDRMSEAVMTTVIKYGKTAILEPNHYDARANLMWASSLALNGYVNRAKSFEGFNHIVEHALSAKYDITHADGLSILIPNWMTYVLDETTSEKMGKFARVVWGVKDIDDMEAARNGIERTRRFFEFLDMPTKLSDLKIDASRLEEILDHAFNGETIGHFKKLNRSDVRTILKNAL